jgi:hypothetical protein
LVHHFAFISTLLSAGACVGEDPVGRSSQPLFFDDPPGVIGVEGDAFVTELDNP